MLKIKDNVDLKELEKFGFKEIKTDFVHTYLINQTSYGLNEIEINVKTRQLYIEILNDDDDMAVMFYDLIKADLVEKVED